MRQGTRDSYLHTAVVEALSGQRSSLYSRASDNPAVAAAGRSSALRIILFPRTLHGTLAGATKELGWFPRASNDEVESVRKSGSECINSSGRMTGNARNKKAIRRAVRVLGALSNVYNTLLEKKRFEEGEHQTGGEQERDAPCRVPLRLRAGVRKLQLNAEWRRKPCDVPLRVSTLILAPVVGSSYFDPVILIHISCL